jgi:hypothetical protein
MQFLSGMNNLGNTANIFKDVMNKLFPFMSKKEAEEYDERLLYKIQPLGGVKPHENFLTFGSGYVTCIHIYAAPEVISRHWLYPLFQLDNVIPTVDIRPLKSSRVKEKIKKTYEEHFTRYNDARDIIEAKDADSAMSRLEKLLDEVNQLGNVVLAVDLRLFISGRTFYELEEKVDEVERQIAKKGFAEFNRNINEQTTEFLSLFTSSEDMQKTLSARAGIPVPANVLAQALPFYYAGMQDSRGYWLGSTYTTSGEGCVFFDPNYIDGYFRTSYDLLICGKKSSGKSTTLKTLVEQQVATGNRIRIIDVTGEFGKLVTTLGGVVVKMDGSKDGGILNPLEILRMGDNDTQNYLKHISKLGLMYRLKKPDCKDNEISMFKKLLKKLYVKFGIIPTENTQVFENITGLNSKKYPIFSDLLVLVCDELNKLNDETTVEAEYNINVLCDIKSVIEEIVGSLGALFNGHTSIPDIVDADVVAFDIQEVSKMGGTTYDMQLFNVLTMAYDSCMSLGIKMKELYDTGKIKSEDIVHHLIILDESQKSINYTKPFAVDYIFDVMSQDRKYFIGVALSTQNLTNVCSENDDAVSTQIKALFELCQYKMIFNQSASAIPAIQKTFQNILTPEQISRIPYLKKREMLFVVSPVQTIQLTCKEVPKERLSYYGGGA